MCDDHQALDRLFNSATAREYRWSRAMLTDPRAMQAFADVDDELSLLAEALIADMLIHSAYGPLDGVSDATRYAFAVGYHYGDPGDAEDEGHDRPIALAEIARLETRGEYHAALDEARAVLTVAWEEIDALRRRPPS